MFGHCAIGLISDHNHISPYMLVKCVIFFCCFCPCSLASDVVQGESSLKELFLHEAPRKWNEYLRHQANIESVQFERLKNTQPNLPVDFTTRETHFIGQYPYAITETVIDENFKFVNGANSKYRFNLKKVDDSWIVSYIAPLENSFSIDKWDFPQNKSDVDRNGSINVITEWTSQGLLLSHKWLPTLINCDEFYIDKIERREEDGEKLIYVRFSYQPKVLTDESMIMNVRKGEILLYPDYYWLIKSGISYFWSEDETYKVEWDYQYDLSAQPTPLLISRTLKSFDEKGKPTIIREIVHTMKETPNYPKSRFTLSHYGLPEPDFGESRTNRVRYVIMALGFLLIVIGLWRMYKKRQEHIT